MRKQEESPNEIRQSSVEEMMERISLSNSQYASEDSETDPLDFDIQITLQDRKQQKKRKSLQILSGNLHKIKIRIFKTAHKRDLQNLMLSVIKHAKARHSLADYINLRYPNTLSFILKFYQFENPDNYVIVKAEIRRVIQEMMKQAGNVELLRQFSISQDRKLNVFKKQYAPYLMEQVEKDIYRNLGLTKEDIEKQNKRQAFEKKLQRAQQGIQEMSEEKGQEMIQNIILQLSSEINSLVSSEMSSPMSSPVSNEILSDNIQSPIIIESQNIKQSKAEQKDPQA